MRLRSLISALADQLHVSVVTIRNDLGALEEDGLLLRGHGGATPAFHPAILRRMRAAREAKLEIARAAAGTHLGWRYHHDCRRDHHRAHPPLPSWQTASAHRDQQHPAAALYVRTNPQLIVTLVGGSFRPADESLTGPLTMEAVEPLPRAARLHRRGRHRSTQQGVFANSVESGDFVRQMASLVPVGNDCPWRMPPNSKPRDSCISSRSGRLTI
jgi:DeoR family transcriptional regulator, galactitol utilization operon repressor